MLGVPDAMRGRDGMAVVGLPQPTVERDWPRGEASAHDRVRLEESRESWCGRIGYTAGSRGVRWNAANPRFQFWSDSQLTRSRARLSTRCPVKHFVSPSHHPFHWPNHWPYHHRNHWPNHWPFVPFDRPL
jgi:hypothetical protein